MSTSMTNFERAVDAVRQTAERFYNMGAAFNICFDPGDVDGFSAVRGDGANGVAVVGAASDWLRVSGMAASSQDMNARKQELARAVREGLNATGLSCYPVFSDGHVTMRFSPAMDNI